MRLKRSVEIRHGSIRYAFFVVAMAAAPWAFAAQGLYVGNDNSPGGISEFGLPVSASSTASFIVPASNTTAVALDSSGNMAIGDFSGNLKFFNAPLSGASTSAASFVNGSGANSGQIAFTSAGDFFASTAGNAINRFTQPFSNASTPSLTITLPVGNAAIGVAVDSAQNLYVANVNGSTGNLLVYAPPYSGPPITTPGVANALHRKIAVSATQAFVNSVDGTTGQVFVYSLPLTNASTPAFSITNGINVPEAVALDASGNLYIGNLVSATVTVYSPPFSAASTPVVTLPLGAISVFGIAIGNAAAGAPVSPVAAPMLDLRVQIALAALLFVAGLAGYARKRREMAFRRCASSR